MTPSVENILMIGTMKAIENYFIVAKDEIESDRWTWLVFTTVS